MSVCNSLRAFGTCCDCVERAVLTRPANVIPKFGVLSPYSEHTRGERERVLNLLPARAGRWSANNSYAEYAEKFCACSKLFLDLDVRQRMKEFCQRMPTHSARGQRFSTGFPAYAGVCQRVGQCRHTLAYTSRWDRAFSEIQRM